VESWSWFPKTSDHLPPTWWLTGMVAIVAGAALVVWSAKGSGKELVDGK
jgi:hypothetical protein